MSGIIAIFNRQGTPILDSEMTPVLKACPERGPDGVGGWVNGPAALGHQKFQLLPEEFNENQPLVLDKLVLTADCRLDNRANIAPLLGMDAETAAKTSDAAFILLAYQRWGLRCPYYLEGDFAFVVWDKANEQIFAARDPLGARDICYYIDNQLCLIASQPTHILAHPSVNPQINENRIAAFLASVWDRDDETYFHGIHNLAPAHTLVVTANTIHLDKYWSAKPIKLEYRAEREYADHYRDLLTTAVRNRLRCTGEIGVSMSGGLDSTSVAALSARILAQSHPDRSRLRSFSYAFDELESCDERVYIRPVVDRYKLDATYIPCDERWPLKNLPQWPVSKDWVLADPFSGLPDSVMQTAQQSGVKLLLTGYFGDTLMTGGHYWALDMLRHRHLGLLMRTTTANLDSIGWQRSFIEFGLRRLVPLNVSKAYRRIRPRTPQTVAPGIGEELVTRTDLLERLAPAPPPSNMASPGLWQRHQSLIAANFSQGIAATRYQYNNYGMEVSMPYFDVRLVEFALSVPGYILGRPSNWRLLHREAMAGILPDPVRLRQERTNFVPLLVKGMRDKEASTVRKLMKNPQVVERGYIRADWLSQQLTRNYVPSADSSLLFRAISLELWLQRYWA